VATRARRTAITRIDVAVLIAVIGMAMTLLTGYLSNARAAARRTTCTDNMRQMGLALRKYALANNYLLPSSADVQENDGKKKVGGWSFHVKLLPFMGRGDLYDSLNLRADPESDDPKAQKALQTSVPEFVCPDNRKPLFLNPKSNPPAGAVANYKGMGATCQQSLAMAAGGGAVPYGTAKMHPDGVLFPTSHSLRVADIADGMAHTVICAETVDDRASRWTVGREAALVGLSNATVQGAAMYKDLYYAPKGFDGQFGPDSALSRAGVRTFLGYDFQGKDAGKYEDTGFAMQPAAFGPSSYHPGVVNHLLADGSVLPIKADVDPAAYMFMITRSGRDPDAVPRSPIKENEKVPATAVRGAAGKVFKEPGVFSVETPESGYAWRKVQDLKAPDSTGAIYVCTKEGSAKVAVLTLQFRRVDGDARKTIVKAHYNGLFGFLEESKFHFLEEKRPSLALPIPDRVPFSIRAQSPNGTIVCLYCESVFGKNTYLIQATAPTNEEARKLFDAVAKSIRELGPNVSQKSDAKSVPGTAPNASDDPYSTGNALLKRGEYDKAIAAYTEAIRIYPKQAVPYFGRGLAYESKAKLDEAIADYSEAIRLNPTFSSPLCRRGELYMWRREVDKAIGDFSAYVQLQPKSVAGYSARGTAFRRKGDLDKAIADYTTAIQLDPNYFPAYDGRALAYGLKRDRAKAIADSSDAIRLKPDNLEAYLHRAGFYMENHEYDKAIADCTLAIQLNPQYRLAYSTRAIVYQLKGDDAKANEDMQHAKELERQEKQKLSGRAGK
jgi:tetratricopeptide (TPR) repeat protein